MRGKSGWPWQQYQVKRSKANSARPEDARLEVAANIAYGLQHILTMYGGIVAVPLIIGQAAGLDPGEIGL